MLAYTPTSPAPRFWGRNVFLSRFWYLSFYSISPTISQTSIKLTTSQGNQHRRDLNAIVGNGKNWEIPNYWPLLLRYLSAPDLAIVFSFAYPEFQTLRYGPLMILGFIVSHITLAVILVCFVMPRYYAIFIPAHRRDEGTEKTLAMRRRTISLRPCSMISRIAAAKRRQWRRCPISMFTVD